MTASHPSNAHLAAAFAAALAAGAINSVAGGGSMISFPVLLALGMPPLIANATNTVGIWPGAVGSIWGFRDEFRRAAAGYRWLIAPAIVGSVIGAILLRKTPPEVFTRIVPALVLFATLAFIVAPAVRRRLPIRATAARRGRGGRLVVAAIAQVAVAIYGGYFGAGMSILMLTNLSLLGMTDMLEMSAMTSFLSLAINGAAGLIFACTGIVDWPYAGAMAIGAVVGGYGAAGLARRVGGAWIRRLVIAVGLGMAAVMLYRLRANSGTHAPLK